MRRRLVGWSAALLSSTMVAGALPTYAQSPTLDDVPKPGALHQPVVGLRYEFGGCHTGTFDDANGQSITGTTHCLKGLLEFIETDWSADPPLGAQQLSVRLSMEMVWDPRIARVYSEFDEVQLLSGVINGPDCPVGCTGGAPITGVNGGSVSTVRPNYGSQWFRLTLMSPYAALGDRENTFTPTTIRTITGYQTQNGRNTAFMTFTPTAITAPEPGTWALLGTGLAAIGGVARRRRRA